VKAAAGQQHSFSAVSIRLQLLQREDYDMLLRMEAAGRQNLAKIYRFTAMAKI
jgi:hypothetical protein